MLILISLLFWVNVISPWCLFSIFHFLSHYEYQVVDQLTYSDDAGS